MATTPPNPKLTPSSTTATNSKVQTVEQRVNNAIETLASPNSPITVYLPTALGGVGNGASGSTYTTGVINTTITSPGGSGVWTAPTSPAITSVQVECGGGGGGGGGGSTGSLEPVLIASGSSTGATVIASITTSTQAPTAAGGILLAVIASNGANLTSALTDTQNNSYKLQWNNTQLNAGSISVYACYSPSPLTAGVDSVTFSTVSTTDIVFSLFYLPDCTAMDPNFSPVLATGTGTSAAVTIPSFTTDTTMVLFANGSSVNTGTASGWTKFGSSQANSTSLDAFYSQAPSNETLTCTTTYASSVSWAALAIAVVTTSTPAKGGAGGGGGEYAVEPAYPVVPGQSYSYTIGFGGQGGVAGTPGEQGGNTVFDAIGTGISGGVVANGGVGGDTLGAGQGGAGGSGSSNTGHYNGGNGGTNSAGVNSDNPVLLSSVSPIAWFVMDDFNAGNYGNGNYFGYDWYRDYGGADYSISKVNQAGGSIIEVQNSDPAPPQVPTSTAAYGGGRSSVKGAALYFYRGSASGTGGFVINNSSAATNSLSNFTVSFWVRGINTSSFTVQNTSAIIAGNSFNSTGWNVSLTNANEVNFFVSNGTTSQTIITAPNSIVSAGSVWNQVVCSFSSGTMTIYVNGVSASTGTYSGSSTLSNPGRDIYISTSPSNQTGYNFQGVLSNLWLASSTVSATDVATAYGSAPASGGSGGGSAAGSATSGNNGSAASSSSGAAGGATVSALTAGVTSQGGPGATGGNSGASGSSGAASITFPAGPLAGGGGGGAGKSSAAVTVQNLQLAVQSSAAYCGPDATGGSAGALYTSSATTPSTNASGTVVNPSIAANGPTVYQGGFSSGNGPSLGTMNSLLLLPSGISSQLAGKTIQRVTLTVTPSTSSSVAMILGYSNDTTIPVSWTGSDIEPLATVQNSGVTATYDITSTGIGAALKSGAATALTLGPGTTPGNAAYNSPNAANYYGIFDGADVPANGGMYLTVSYTTGTAISGGNGASGYIAITYVNPNGIPVAGINPESLIDVTGNTWAAGYTGQVTAFDPTQTSPGNFTPETWKTVTLSGWTVNSPLQYKKYSTNQVCIRGEISPGSAVASGATLFTLPPGYTPASVHRLTASYNTGGVVTPLVVQVSPSGAVITYYAMAASVTLNLDLLFSLD